MPAPTSNPSKRSCVPEWVSAPMPITITPAITSFDRITATSTRSTRRSAPAACGHISVAERQRQEADQHVDESFADEQFEPHEQRRERAHRGDQEERKEALRSVRSPSAPRPAAR